MITSIVLLLTLIGHNMVTRAIKPRIEVHIVAHMKTNNMCYWNKIRKIYFKFFQFNLRCYLDEFQLSSNVCHLRENKSLYHLINVTRFPYEKSAVKKQIQNNTFLLLIVFGSNFTF